MRIYLLLAMAASVSFIGASCGIKGVGDPCVPEDEYLNSFSGFSQSEVNVESRSFQCLTRICLVNHFQGRVSCPYGQSEDPDAKNSGLSTCMGTEAHRNSDDCQPGGAEHQFSCQVPARDGSRWEQRILPPVEAQLKNRQADEAVYCSCRCAGPNGETGGEYCECPSGFACTELVEDLGLGKGQLAGSYCIVEGTEYNPGLPEKEECTSGNPNCNDDYNIVLEGGVRSGRNQRAGACLPPGAECTSDDTCCGPVTSLQCYDANSANAENPSNCDGVCINGTTCRHGEGAGLDENMKQVERVDCPGNGICPAR